MQYSEYRHRFATNAACKIESRWVLAVGIPANRVVFQWSLRTPLRRKKGEHSGRRLPSCFEYPQYASPTASSSPCYLRAIPFSSPGAQSASPTFFVVAHRLYLTSLFALSLLLTPLASSPLPVCGRSLKGVVFSLVSFLFLGESSSSKFFPLASLANHNRRYHASTAKAHPFREISLCRARRQLDGKRDFGFILFITRRWLRDNACWRKP